MSLGRGARGHGGVVCPPRHPLTKAPAPGPPRPLPHSTGVYLGCPPSFSPPAALPITVTARPPPSLSFLPPPRTGRAGRRGAARQRCRRCGRRRPQSPWWQRRAARRQQCETAGAMPAVEGFQFAFSPPSLPLSSRQQWMSWCQAGGADYRRDLLFPIYVDRSPLPPSHPVLSGSLQSLQPERKVFLFHSRLCASLLLLLC